MSFGQQADDGFNNNNNNNAFPTFMLILSNTKPFQHVHVTEAPKEGAAGLKTPQIEIKKKL